jgi:Concanavalin A-like lectin/glucanases superfamily/Domain of unknown function (DUF2341)
VLLLAANSLFWQLRCSSNVTVAGGSEIRNPITISAVIVDSTDEPVAGISVALVPIDYNCLKNPLGLGKTANLSERTIAYPAITDANGKIRIQVQDSGLFNLVAATDDYKFNLYSPSIAIGASPALNLGAVHLRAPGTVMVRIDSSVFKAGSDLLVLGSVIFTPVEKPGIIALKVPCGSSSIQYVTSSGDSIAGGLLLRNISVGEGETVLEPSGPDCPEWKFSRKLLLNTTVSGAGVSGNVVNFPVLIRLTNSNFDFTQAGPTGADVRFTKQDNTSLPYEIEQWDAAAQSALIWIKVDTVYGNDSTHFITMYWGASTGSATVSLSNGAAVFDTGIGFQGVWHLAEAGNAIAHDATINHYDGTPLGMTSSSTVPGAVGNAREFNGISGYIDVHGTASGKLNVPQEGPFMVSAWVFAAGADTGTYYKIAAKGIIQYHLQINASQWEFSDFQNMQGWNVVRTNTQFTQWKYVVGVRQGTRQFLYVDGECFDSIVNVGITSGSVVRDTTDDFTIGGVTGGTWDYFNGKIDEVRILNRAPDAQWVRLCYMNQKANDQLVVFR